MVDGIKVPADVGIKHPVHLLAEDADRKRVQRIVLASLRSEPIREAEEVRLVDGIEHLDDGSLDDLVLQARNAQGSLSSVRLRDVASPRGSCPVRSAVQSRVQVSQVFLELLRVLLPCDAVNARRSILLQCKARPAEPLDIDMVKERGELYPLVPDCDLTHTVERIGRAGPALCPGRVLPARVSLGQVPSLRPLHHQGLGPCSVRRFLRYYGPVRLPSFVHQRRTP